MLRAISFSLSFSTDELAVKFIDKATRSYDVPCLRYGRVVYMVAEDVVQMREVLSIGREFGGEDLTPSS